MITKVKSLKQGLLDGRLLIGSWITLAHPAVAEIMSQNYFDWLAIDLEHSVITIREAEELIRIINLSGISSLVRLTANNAEQIKQVMDAGSHGIIVPMVNSKADALRAVSAIYYPPKGKRGVGLARAQKYGAGFVDYLKWLESNAVIIVQIEHINAVHNFEDIFSIPEVDGYFIGPYDLSASMGLAGQLDHPQVLEAINHVNKAAKRMQKPGGLHIIEPNPKLLSQKIKEGFKFIAYSLDIRMLDCSCREGLKEIQK